MNLTILDPVFSVLKLPQAATVPPWALNCHLFSITRTDEELSIVCPASCLTVDELFEDLETGWKCLKVEGVLAFSLTGILSSLAKPLAEHDISIFAVSTYKTDCLLVKSLSIEKAKAVLEQEGHTFTS